jgi:hypothetical protein
MLVSLSQLESEFPSLPSRPTPSCPPHTNGLHPSQCGASHYVAGARGGCPPIDLPREKVIGFVIRLIV